METYLVDYENVGSSGLDGIKDLTKLNRVVVFYSSSVGKIDINAFANVQAKLKFIKAECGTANALDFQLVTYLCINAKKRNKYFIVSVDRGYTPVINMLKEFGISVEEISSIGAAIGNKTEDPKENADNITGS